MKTADKLIAIAENEQKVYDAGKRAEWSGFWDACQAPENPARDARYLFAGAAWNDKTFKPKHDIVLKGYAHSLFLSSRITNIRKRLEEQGVTLDTSGATNLSSGFASTITTELPTVSTVGCTGTISYLFAWTSSLVSIEKVIFKEDGSQTFTGLFDSTTNLQEIRIEGVIGQDFNIYSSKKLSHDSLMSIIYALKDYSAETVTRILSISPTNLNKLTDAEKAIATQKGWTLA